MSCNRRVLTSLQGIKRRGLPILLSAALAAAVVWGGCCGPSRDQRGPADAPRLREGTRIEETLTSGDVDVYLVELRDDDFLQLTVEQQGVDVEVEIIDPTGQRALVVDSPIGGHGPELVCFVAEASGLHGVQIRPFLDTAAGRYALVLDEVRPASSRDRSCMKAILAFNAAQDRRSQLDGGVSGELIPLYEKARELRRAAGHPFEEAITVYELGKLHAELGDVPARLSCFEEALSLIRADGRYRQEVEILNHLGLAQRLLGEIRQAQASFAEALKLAREYQDGIGEATALNNIALLERSRGDVHQAIQHYEDVLRRWQALNRPDQAAVTLHNLGVSYTAAGRFENALDVLGEALELHRQFRNRDKEAGTLSAIGWAHYLSGDAEKALDYYEQAIELSRLDGNVPKEAEALDRLGTAYRAIGRLDPALDAYREALRISEKSGNRRDTAHSVANVGWLLQDLGRSDEARAELERARDLFRELYDPDASAYVLAGLAAAQRSLGNPDTARKHIEEAIDIVHSLRASARRLGAYEHPHSLWQDYYEFYVDLLMELHAAEPTAGHQELAFEVSDHARARNLYEMLLESAIDLRHGADAALLARERDVQDRLNETEQQRSVVADGAQDDEIAALTRKLHDLLLEYEEIRAEIRCSHPRFAEISDPRPVPLAELRQLLDERTRLLSYVLGEQRSFLFVLGPTSIRSYVLPPRKEIEFRAKTVYDGLKNSFQRRARRQTGVVAARLSEQLLEPVIEERGVERLLIVGEGALQYLPFAALPLPEESGSERLLIDEYEVIHLPSAAALVALRRRAARRPPPAKRFAVLADPVFCADDPRVPAATAPDGSSTDRGPAHGPLTDATPANETESEYKRLLSSGQEAQSILAMVAPAERFAAIGFAASRELAISGALADYRMLHFATHAEIDDQHPKLSGIVLSMVDEQRRPREGHLRLHEIFSLELPADLVVLSACSTALGEQIRGDGIVGLTRGFFYAGASRLIVSLWNVADTATAELMTEFYRGLLDEGLSPAAALRQAQQRMRAREPWQAPFYWAGFVLQGEWR